MKDIRVFRESILLQENIKKTFFFFYTISYFLGSRDTSAVHASGRHGFTIKRTKILFYTNIYHLTPTRFESRGYEIFAPRLSGKLPSSLLCTISIQIAWINGVC